MDMLASIEKGFIEPRTAARPAVDHAKVLEKTVALFTSKQMGAFKINNERQGARRYGRTASATAA